MSAAPAPRPQTCIKYAGLPWEMGLSEAHQVLTLNACATGCSCAPTAASRPAATWSSPPCSGAEEFGIGTARLVAMGCIMVRQCHCNTCPVGVCTQDETLRAEVHRHARRR